MAYKSKFEVSVAKALKAKGTKFQYEPEVVHFVQPEKKRKYKPDFKITGKDGRPIFIEAKGKLDLDARQKMVWVRDQNKDKNIVFLFMDARKRLSKRSKTTYGQWASDNGFTWFDFRDGLPKDWSKGGHEL